MLQVLVTCELAVNIYILCHCTLFGRLKKVLLKKPKTKLICRKPCHFSLIVGERCNKQSFFIQVAARNIIYNDKYLNIVSL